MKNSELSFPRRGGTIIPCVLLIIFCSTASWSQIRLVADLNPALMDGGGGTPGYHQASGGRSFFLEDNVELWTSDGTTEGTVRIREFEDVTEMLVINGVAYLTVFAEELGFELWKSDGTITGTSLVKDIYPGSGSSSPMYLVNFNGALFFSANNRINGRELWRSDGTPTGTQLVADLEGGGVISSNPSKLVVSGSKLFFVANNGFSGYELFVTDGTGAGTYMVKDIHPDSGVSSAPGELTDVSGLLFFSANTPNLDRQLWKSNGTAEGTQLVKVIREGKRTAHIKKIVNVNGTAFFEANDGIHGLELWKSDGTPAGTQLVKDITPGPGSATQYATDHLNHMTAGLGLLFFTAVTDNLGHGLWVSNGTDAGTYPITDHDLGFAFSNPGFHQLNGAMYFIARQPDGDYAGLFKTDGNIAELVKANLSYSYFNDVMFRELNGYLYFLTQNQYWRTDGTTEGTSAIFTNLHYPGGSFPSHLSDLNGTLYFRRGPFAEEGLWKSDGTSATTVKVKDLTGIETPKSYNNNLYFLAGNRRSVHRTDGTTDGTIELSSEARHPREFAGVNGLMFFAAYGAGGEELWQSDGTVAGTKMTKDVNPGPTHSGPRYLTPVSNTLFFATYQVGTANELWKSNGTPEGTVLVKDINPGEASGAPMNMIQFGGRLYFQANNGLHGLELWTSDGSSGGTYLLNDLRAGDLTGEVDMGPMMAHQRFFIFSAHNELNKTALWRSNGAAGGTTKLIDFGTTGFASMLAVTKAHIFFLVPFNGYQELWLTDGTSAGTKRLRKLTSSALAFRNTAAVVNDILYFSVEYYPTGTTTIIRSNGRSFGTFEIPFDGRASNLTASGSLVYFTGLTREYGSELYVIDESVGATALEEEDVTDEVRNLSSYPNPFRSSFALRVNGALGESFDFTVVTINGETISDSATLPCNVTHSIGAAWNTGMYIVWIAGQNRTAVKKMIKIQ